MKELAEAAVHDNGTEVSVGFGPDEVVGADVHCVRPACLRTCRREAHGQEEPCEDRDGSHRHPFPFTFSTIGNFKELPGPLGTQSIPELATRVRVGLGSALTHGALNAWPVRTSGAPVR